MLTYSDLAICLVSAIEVRRSHADNALVFRNYVDQSTAVADNLTYASGDTLVMRCDDTTTLSSSGAGRNSVRLKSNAQYTTHVVVYVRV